VDALIPAFIAVLLAETGDRVQHQAHQLGLSFSDRRAIYAALVVATLITLLTGAIGGALIARLLTFEARTLFTALALLIAGLPMLIKVTPAKPAHSSRPFMTSLIRFFPAQIAGASPFVIASLSARTDMAGFAFAGGFVAILVAATPPLLLREEWPGTFPLGALRYVAGALLIGAGLWLGLGALRLI
jgi:Ca2+/H+ antiporter, TMEM165/GDT1 family